MTFPEPLNPRLVDALYTEAMLLADEARSYFDHGGRADRLALEPLARVGFSCEALKVTTRLMHIIAWLLTRRAADAGEIAAAASDGAARRLGQASATDMDAVEAYPAAARALIAASADLYARVARLAENRGADAASPARALYSRLERSL